MFCFVWFCFPLSHSKPRDDEAASCRCCCHHHRRRLCRWNAQCETVDTRRLKWLQYLQHQWFREWMKKRVEEVLLSITVFIHMTIDTKLIVTMLCCVLQVVIRIKTKVNFHIYLLVTVEMCSSREKEMKESEQRD